MLCVWLTHFPHAHNQRWASRIGFYNLDSTDVLLWHKCGTLLSTNATEPNGFLGKIRTCSNEFSRSNWTLLTIAQCMYQTHTHAWIYTHTQRHLHTHEQVHVRTYTTTSPNDTINPLISLIYSSFVFALSSVFIPSFIWVAVCVFCFYFSRNGI